MIGEQWQTANCVIALRDTLGQAGVAIAGLADLENVNNTFSFHRID